MKFSSRYIEEAVDNYLLEAEVSFKLEDIVKSVSETLAADESDISDIKQEVESLLKEYHLFFDVDKRRYITQSAFFEKAQFCVTPSEYEISNGFLVPGHRFAPFTCESVFPSEVEINLTGESKPIATRDEKCAIHDAASLHTLLGSEEMFHYFIADHQENHKIIAAGNPEADLLLTVFDLKKFYEDNSFTAGDAIIFTVEDWDNGIFSFKYKSKAERLDDAKSKWAESFEKALGYVFEDKGYYTTIPQQLALAFFIARDDIFDNPAMSIDEFVAESGNIEIIMVGGQTVLWSRDEPVETESEDSYIPDQGVMVSQGEIDSIDALLKDIGCGITPVELDSLMYNELFQGGESLEPVIDRVLYFKDGSFSDDAQEAIFLNYLEERWEELLEVYRRDSDQDKGVVRRRILQFLDERLRFFLELGDAKDKIQVELNEALDNSVENLCNILALLNSDQLIGDQEEFDKVMEGVEQLGEAQSHILSEIELSLN